MIPRKLIFTEPPPSLNGLLGRTILAMGAVLAASLMIMVLWHSANWPGSTAARALVLGFGIAFAARYASTGRLRGPHVSVQIGIGALSSALFYALWMFASS